MTIWQWVYGLVQVCIVGGFFGYLWWSIRRDPRKETPPALLPPALPAISQDDGHRLGVPKQRRRVRAGACLIDSDSVDGSLISKSAPVGASSHRPYQ